MPRERRDAAAAGRHEPREAERRADTILASLEVAGVAGQRPGHVSGGEGQRVAVARALVTDPRVVFADEPTGALDSLNGERVMELLTGAARERGTAVVLVTHEARVAAYSDREVVVRDGRTLRARVVVRELALGARLTLAGGRSGLLRTAITALGVALGVAVLLIAASIPSIQDERRAREHARSDLGLDRRRARVAPVCSWPMRTRASASATSADGSCRPTARAHRPAGGAARAARRARSSSRPRCTGCSRRPTVARCSRRDSRNHRG